MIVRLLGTILFILSATWIVYGNDSYLSVDPSSTNSTDQEVNSLLWKVSGNGLNSPSYVFGTIHIIDSEDYFLPAGTEPSFDKCEEVVFEIDMDDMTDFSQLFPILQNLMMPEGQTLKTLLSEEDYQMVQSHFQELGLPIFMLERIKPMFLTVFASGDISPGDLQNGSMRSYEMELNNMAKEKGKETGGLETIEFQMQVFDRIPYKDQADMLVEALSAGDDEDGQFQELVDMYKAQNIHELYRMMKGDENITKYEDVLLVQRNENWIPVMKEKMHKYSTFFAVGAGHLAGPKGVLKLLEDEGYEVEAVRAL